MLSVGNKPIVLRAVRLCVCVANKVIMLSVVILCRK
jgi:hypothetical protein